MAKASPLTSGSFGSGSARMRVYLSRYASRSMSRMWHRISRIDHLPGAGVKRSSFFGTPRSASLRAAGVAASVSRWRARSFTMGDVVSGMGGSRLGKWLFRLREEQFLRFEAKEKRVEDERAPLVAARGIEREVRNTPRRECLLDGVVDFPLEREIRVAHAVEARIADDRHLEERVVRRRPAPHEALENGFRRGARERPPHVAVVVEDGAIAEDDVGLGLGLELPGDLRMEDPGLRLECRLPVDRQRALPRDLTDELDGEVSLLERRREVVAEGGLSEAVRADERDFHPDRRISAVCGTSRAGSPGVHDVTFEPSPARAARGRPGPDLTLKTASRRESARARPSCRACGRSNASPGGARPREPREPARGRGGRDRASRACCASCAGRCYTRNRPPEARE